MGNSLINGQFSITNYVKVPESIHGLDMVG